MKVGDKVLYVPDECHALTPDLTTGKYLFKMGVRKRTSAGEVIEELSEDGLTERLKAIRRNPRGREDRKNLVVISPVIKWPATVTAINPDGSVALNIKHGPGDNCLDCPSVKVESSGKIPHTCHPVPVLTNEPTISNLEE